MAKPISALMAKNVTWHQSYGHVTTVRILLALLLTSWIAFTLSRSVYRLYFHPLSRFPGPLKGCLSQNWLLEQSKTGKAEEIFARLHKKYNTSALRIGPNELHINDVNFYKVIYNQTATFPKHKGFYDAFGTPHTVFVETDTALHKVRRKALNPFFSRTALLKIELLIEEKTENIIERLRQLSSSSISYDMYNAFRCITVDIISDYSFGKSLDLTIKSDPNFDHDFFHVFDILADGLWNFAYNPSLRFLAARTPRWLAEKSSKLAPIFGLIGYADHSLSDLRSSPKSAKVAVFQALRSTSHEEAIAEAMDFFAAGSDTTAYTLTVAVAQLIKHSIVKKKLSDALLEAIPDPSNFPSLIELEKIPLLTACVKESLRVAKAVPGRLPRVVPGGGEPFIIDNKVVPSGTVVGMSATTMHNDQRLWGKDAASFNPERWLASKTLDPNLVAFSKGPRSCLGQNMATFELTIVLARLFRKFDFEFAEGGGIPQENDTFTASVIKPGLLVRVKEVD